MSNQAENKISPVEEVDSFLPNGELKETTIETIHLTLERLYTLYLKDSALDT